MMEAYIDNKKQFYESFIDFLENSEGEMNENKHISSIMENQEIEADHDEMNQFLQMIRNIGDNHHHNRNFITKLNQILYHYKDQIKQSLSNIEIYHIFENSKLLLLFLLIIIHHLSITIHHSFITNLHSLINILHSLITILH